MVGEAALVKQINEHYKNIMTAIRYKHTHSVRPSFLPAMRNDRCQCGYRRWTMRRQYNCNGELEMRTNTIKSGNYLVFVYFVYQTFVHCLGAYAVCSIVLHSSIYYSSILALYSFCINSNSSYAVCAKIVHILAVKTKDHRIFTYLQYTKEFILRA